MYCSACGKKCPDGARFCAWCGEKLPDLSLEPALETAESAAPIETEAPAPASNAPDLSAPLQVPAEPANAPKPPEQVGLDIDRLEFGHAGQDSPASDDDETAEPPKPAAQPIRRPASQFSRADDLRTVRPLPPNPAQPPRGEQAEEAARRAALEELVFDGGQAEDTTAQAALIGLDFDSGEPVVPEPPMRRADRKGHKPAPEDVDWDDLDGESDAPHKSAGSGAGARANSPRGGLSFLRLRSGDENWDDERPAKPRGMLGFLWPGKAKKAVSVGAKPNSPDEGDDLDVDPDGDLNVDLGGERPTAPLTNPRASRPEKPEPGTRGERPAKPRENSRFARPEKAGLDDPRGERPAKPRENPRFARPEKAGLDDVRGERPAKPREDMRFMRPEKAETSDLRGERPANPREDSRFARPEKAETGDLRGERPANPREDSRFARPGNPGRDGSKPAYPSRNEKPADPRGGDKPRPPRTDRGKAVTAWGGMVTPPARRAPIASLSGLRPPRKPKNDLFFEDLEMPKENYYDEAAEEWALARRIKGIVALMLLVGIAVITVWLLWMPGGQLFRARWNMGAPATAYKTLGDQERENGQIARAADAYYSALKLDPDNYEYALLVGQTQDIIGNWENAAKAYMVCVNLKPQAVQPYKLLVDLYTMQGNAQMAENWRAEGYLKTDDPTLAPPAS